MNLKEIKKKAKAKYVEITTKVHDFYVQHETEIWTVGSVAIPAIVAVSKAASKSYTAHKEEQHRLLTQYDPATGCYNQLRRQLTAQDWDRIMSMKRQMGITITECLIRLNLVK